MTNPTTTPKTVHGYPILAASATPGGNGTRPGHVILVRNDQGEFVTGWLGEGDSNWTWGHYFTERGEAQADYEARVRRGY